MEGGKFLSNEHPKISGFELALRKLLSKMDKAVWSMGKIVLPFRVETEMDITHPFWEDVEVRMLYVGLKASQDAYTQSVEKQNLVKSFQLHRHH